MKVSVKPGKYVIAVSGGIDSMVLLAMLKELSGVELIVAHFDHGIREDSGLDRQLVEATAARYGLPCKSSKGKLGPTASEEQARQARYAFLQEVRQAAGAEAIITAHHQDDLLETGIINMLRGTGRKGLSSLASTPGLIRPLLAYRKADIFDQAMKIYRQDPGFYWHEDSTNASDRYLRNYVRRHIMKGLGPSGRELLLEHVLRAAEHNPLIDSLLLHEMDNAAHPDRLPRQWFIMLPYDVSCEVMTVWLRQNGVRSFDRKAIARLVVAAKVAFPGKQADINAGYFLKTGKRTLRITRGSSS